jgi:hypothetical protein
MSTSPGPYYQIGQIVRKARKAKRMTRRQLVQWICMVPTLDMTQASASFMVRELEDLGLVMNTDVLRRILHVLDIDHADVADLLAQAKADSAAAFAADMKRFARSMAKDQGREEGEVLAGLVKVVETQSGRPMT